MCDETEDMVYATPEMIELVADLIASRYRKHAIKRLIDEAAERKLSRGTHEKILKLARRKILREVRQDKNTHRAKAVAFLQLVIRDEKLDVKRRLEANEQLTKMLRLDLEDDGPNKEDPAERLREVLAQMRSATSPTPTEAGKEASKE